MERNECRTSKCSSGQHLLLQLASHSVGTTSSIAQTRTITAPAAAARNGNIGRISAECGFCGTAVPLAEARHDKVGPRGGNASSGLRIATNSADQRRHPRMPAKARKLQLLIDGSPRSTPTSTTTSIANVTSSIDQPTRHSARPPWPSGSRCSPEPAHQRPNCANRRFVRVSLTAPRRLFIFRWYIPSLRVVFFAEP